MHLIQQWYLCCSHSPLLFFLATAPTSFFGGESLLNVIHSDDIRMEISLNSHNVCILVH